MEREILLLDIAREIDGFVDAPTDYKIGVRDGFKATIKLIKNRANDHTTTAS